MHSRRARPQSLHAIRTRQHTAGLQRFVMIRLSRALRAWGTPGFNDILKETLRHMGVDELPLQQGLTTGSYALDDKLDVNIISAVEEGGTVRVKAGIFYSGMIPGCSCADDPTPVDEHTEYCVVQLAIDTTTAVTTITLVTE